MQDGKVIFNKGFGLASTGRNAPVTPTTLFAVGSVTKQFTCAVALQLEQEGKLSFDDRVSRYRADFGHANEITLRDLGNHVSGYRDYYPLDFVDRPMAKDIPEDDLLKTFTNKPLDFPPGTRYSYSNTGYLLLGQIASMVSRKPFEQLLQERIFTPLGMTHTRFEPTRGAPGLAEGYTQFGLGPSELSIPEGKGWIGAAGGIWTHAGRPDEVGSRVDGRQGAEREVVEDDDHAARAERWSIERVWLRTAAARSRTGAGGAARRRRERVRRAQRDDSRRRARQWS